MNILTIGDVVGSAGCAFLRARLPSLKSVYKIDMTIVNGENSAEGNGVTPASATHIFDSGADVITTGNHALRRKEIAELLDKDIGLIRPANFHRSAPGKGVFIYTAGRLNVAVVNLIGTVYMQNNTNVFDTMDELLPTLETKFIFVDIHAEATSEKSALAQYLDGKVSAVFGTHTHVQTADEKILPGGTGFVTDLGMCGPVHSVLGVETELAVESIRTGLPTRFQFAKGECCLGCVVFTVDDVTGRTTGITRLNIQ